MIPLITRHTNPFNPVRSPLVTVVLASLGYFLLVFSAGFILGVVRALLLVPEMGERNAELIEMPLMLIVIYFSARLVVKHTMSLPRQFSYLTVGVVALGLLLAIEFTVVLGLREISLREYFALRDPVSGLAYAISLIIYMLMPYLLAKKSSSVGMKPELCNAIRAWRSDSFFKTLKNELEQLESGLLPLEQCVAQGGYVGDHRITATILHADEDAQAVHAKAGIFFTEIVINCGCGDDPMETNAYCELKIKIDKISGQAEFAVIQNNA